MLAISQSVSTLLVWSTGSFFDAIVKTTIRSVEQQINIGFLYRNEKVYKSEQIFQRK